MHKIYETTDVFYHNGIEVPVGTRLTLHVNEAKHLGHVLEEAKPKEEPAAEGEPSEVEQIKAAEAVVPDPRAEALLPLIDRRATRRKSL